MAPYLENQRWEVIVHINFPWKCQMQETFRSLKSTERNSATLSLKNKFGLAVNVRWKIVETCPCVKPNLLPHFQLSKPNLSEVAQDKLLLAGIEGRLEKILKFVILQILPELKETSLWCETCWKSIVILGMLLEPTVENVLLGHRSQSQHHVRSVVLVFVLLRFNTTKVTKIWFFLIPFESY